MRRRLVLSTIAVVLIVILVLLVPVLLVVRDAEGGELPADVLARLAVIAVAAIASAALLAGVQARQLARPLERLARSASRRCTSVTDFAKRVRKVASSSAEAPPPTTAMSWSRKKNPSQVAHQDTPCPDRRFSSGSPSSR